MDTIRAEDHYDSIAAQYDGIEALPHSLISRQLVQYALGDCTDQVILDIGGGSGLHARIAISRGATRVDNVDLSPEMLRNCDLAETKLGRQPGEKIACFVADATQPLDHLNLPGRDGNGFYDTVLVGWTLDHASTMAELEGMWHNIAKYCRPGGRLVNIRTIDPFNRHPNSSKYGVKIFDVKPIPGGAKYFYAPVVDGKLLFTCEAQAMEAHYNLNQAHSMAQKYGFDGLEKVPAMEMPCVKADPEFWQDFVNQESFCCVVGRKL